MSTQVASLALALGGPALALATGLGVAWINAGKDKGLSRDQQREARVSRLEERADDLQERIAVKDGEIATLHTTILALTRKQLRTEGDLEDARREIAVLNAKEAVLVREKEQLAADLAALRERITRGERAQAHAAS